MEKIREFMIKIIESAADMRDRVFIMFTFMVETAVAIAFIGDLILGENRIETITLGIVLVAAPVMTVLLIKLGP